MTGYTLVGEEFRICEDDSTWSGVEPKCAIECEELPPIENGYIDKSAGSWEGATVTYVCNNDYALVGDSTRSSEYTGKWKGLAPTCLFAIVPDIVLVLGSMFLFIVLVDIFVLVFFLYYKYHKKKEEIKFDDLEKKEDEEKDDEDDKSFDDTMVKPPGFSVEHAGARIFHSMLDMHIFVNFMLCLLTLLTEVTLLVPHFGVSPNLVSNTKLR